MTGRKRRSSKRREGSVSRPNPLIDESQVSRRPSPCSSVAALEDRVAAQHRHIQSLLLDNRSLAATHVALKQEISAAQQEFRHLSSAVADVKAERDLEVRQIYEKSLNMDAQVRSIDAITSDLLQVRTDIHDLGAASNDLASQFQAIQTELSRLRAESHHLPAIKAEIEAMRHEIQRGRNAIEYEKKTHASNLEHRQAMDKNMIIMVHEVEKLRVELSNAEKRARAAVAVAAVTNPSPGYPANYDNHEMGYGVNAFSDSYSMHQIQAGADALPQYASGAALQHPYELQTHVNR